MNKTELGELRDSFNAAQTSPRQAVGAILEHLAGQSGSSGGSSGSSSGGSSKSRSKSRSASSRKAGSGTSGGK